MQMTSSIIYWRLSNSVLLEKTCGRSTDVTVNRVRVFHDSTPLEAGCLYVADSQSVSKTPVLRQDVAFVFCNLDASMHLPFDPKTDYCVVAESISVEDLLEDIFDCWTAVVDWDARMSAAVLSEDHVDDVFSIGAELLDRKFGIHDTSLKMIFRTKDFITDLGVSEDSSDYLKIVRAHALNSEFHRAILKDAPFYYDDDQADKQLMCINMRYETRFIARLIVPMEDDEKVMDPGEMQLFSIYATHIEDAYRHDASVFLPQRRNQALRDMFKYLMNGAKLSRTNMENILRASGWSVDQNFIVIVFRLHVEPGWVVRKDVSQAFLCRQLEWEWPQSCAVEHDEDIAWVINLDAAGLSADDYDLFQSMAGFVRDNVCNAGISRLFSDFAQYPQAITQADAALAIGMIKNPHFWYYPFDQYKLDYLRQKMTEDMPVIQLCHPAILKLKAHDEEKETDLSRTLECYLNCEQNAATASERMFIHRSTFFRRLEHIRELTNVDLDDPQEVLYLRLSYWLLS